MARHCREVTRREGTAQTRMTPAGRSQVTSSRYADLSQSKGETDAMHTCYSPSRRRVLAFSAGLAATAWLPGSPALAEEKTGPPSRLIARPIPHSGESLPSVGLGTSQVFEVGDDPARRKACAEVIRTLVAGGGKLIDTAPEVARSLPVHRYHNLIRG